VVAYIEAPAGWGPRQMMIGHLERTLGYRVTMVGAGEIWKLYLSDVSA
jgi:hypothetical protein